jgi:hypothetical protein
MLWLYVLVFKMKDFNPMPSVYSYNTPVSYSLRRAQRTVGYAPYLEAVFNRNSRTRLECLQIYVEPLSV